MSERRLTARARREIAERAAHCCEYCMSQSGFCPDPFAVEHVIPKSRGGTNQVSNLAHCCEGCNNAKYDHVQGRDPFTGETVRLFHPRKDRWLEHFEWDPTGALVVGLTSIGRATIVRLQMNRTGLQNLRQVLVVVRRHPPKHAMKASE